MNFAMNLSITNDAVLRSNVDNYLSKNVSTMDDSHFFEITDDEDVYDDEANSEIDNADKTVCSGTNCSALSESILESSVYETALGMFLSNGF